MNTTTRKPRTARQPAQPVKAGAPTFQAYVTSIDEAPRLVPAPPLPQLRRDYLAQWGIDPKIAGMTPVEEWTPADVRRFVDHLAEPEVTAPLVITRIAPVFGPRAYTPVTPMDPHRVALRTDGNLYIQPSLAQEVHTAHMAAIGIDLGDLADVTQWMRDWAYNPGDVAGPRHQEEYIGDGEFLGEHWMVYANILRGTRVLRYVGYPSHNADGSRVEVHVAVAR